jgi:hypothetical protein
LITITLIMPDLTTWTLKPQDNEKSKKKIALEFSEKPFYDKKNQF